MRSRTHLVYLQRWVTLFRYLRHLLNGRDRRRFGNNNDFLSLFLHEAISRNFNSIIAAYCLRQRRR